MGAPEGLLQDGSINEGPLVDAINLFSEGNNTSGHPNNFMDLDSSSDGDTDAGIYWEAGCCNDNSSCTTPPSKGDGSATITTSNNSGSQSSKLPQTEFEKQPYSENTPLPKSQSDPTSLGKENK